MSDVERLQWLASAASDALRRGDRAQAFEYLAQARAGAGDNPGALNYISQLYAQASRPAVAAEILQQLAGRFPDDPTLLFNLAQMLRKADRFEKAALTFRRVHELSPDDSEARILWAIESARARDYETAMEVLRGAIADGVEAVNARYLLASFLEMKGRFDDARDNAERVIGEAPGHIGAHCIIAKIDRRDGDTDSAIRRLEALLPMDPADPLTSAAEYELVRLYDQARRPDQAIAACQRAARSVHARVPDAKLRAAEYRRRLGVLLEAFTPGWAGRWRNIRIDGARPVFLVGFPRSGTTLLDQVLDAHEGFHVMEERDALATVIDRIERPGGEFTGGYPGALESLDGDQLASLRETYWQRVGEEIELTAGQVLVDKLPLSAVHLGLIQRLFPGARIILALRHPLDAVLSCYMQFFGINDSMANFLDTDDAVATYDLVMRLVERYRELFDLNLIEVRYEDVVADLEGQVRRLLTFLDAPFDPSVLAFHDHSRRRGAINTPSYDQVSRPIYTEARYRWRRYRNLVRPWATGLGHWIEAYGYDTDGL